MSVIPGSIRHLPILQEEDSKHKPEVSDGNSTEDEGPSSCPSMTDSSPSDGWKSRVTSTGSSPESFDSDWDTDLEVQDTRSAYDLSGAKIYQEGCRQLGVVPVSYFIRHITDESLIMRHHGLGPLGMKALSVPLVTNTAVLKLDIEDNWIEGEGAKYLSDMLKENCYIADLSVARNCLGSVGARAMSNMLRDNINLVRVNLAGNGFKDKTAWRFARTLNDNNHIKDLNLSHNEFAARGGALLGHAIGENETLEEIDLSWNHFRKTAALQIVEGVLASATLKKANLAWNGLGIEGALAAREGLKMNTVLLELDLSNNRITMEGAIMIAQGLAVNETLKVLKIGYNSFGPGGAGVLLQAINNERSIISVLDLDGISVDKSFEAGHQSMVEGGRDLTVKHAGVLSNYVIKGVYRKKKIPEGDALDLEELAAMEAVETEPLAIIQMFIFRKKIQMLDFFQQFDQENKFNITMDEFKKGIKQAKIGLSDEKVDELVGRLDKSPKDCLDYRPFVEET